MKKIHKSTFFIVVALIALFAVSAITGFDYFYGDNKTTVVKGIDDIRLGIDIQGGVDVTFAPADGFDASDRQLDAATATLKTRLSTLGINDNEIYSDYKSDRIIVRFPWQAGESEYDAEAAVKELGEMAELTFRRGDTYETDEDGNIIPTGEIILKGADVADADYMQQPDDYGNFQWVVTLALNDSGKQAFAEATAELTGTGTPISIWMDSTMISAPSVNNAITDGNAVITGNFDNESSKKLADQINSGALPFKLVTDSFSTISPTLGTGARDAMAISGLIAFALISVIMIALYKLPGAVAVISLAGQVAGTFAAITGFFSFNDSFTLTIPGIAGIILAVGMGVDANVITNERIKEELHAGKTIDGALYTGFKRAFAAIFDGNITMLIIAVILMGAFGTPDSWCSIILTPIFTWFGVSTAGSIYSFGYTLAVGVVLNFVFGIFTTRLMTMSLSRFKVFRKPALYGGKKAERSGN